MSERITSARRIAEVIGYDVSEMPDYRYQPTRYSLAVYAIGDFYYCSPARKPHANLPKVGVVWRECGRFRDVVVYCGEMNSAPDAV